MLQTIKELTTTTIAYGLGMKSSNIGEESFLIFDHGGDMCNR